MADWVTVEPSLDPLLEPIDPVLTQIDSVLSFLITILNIVQTILNIIKVFLVGFLDPLRTLVELVIEEVRNLIADLRQLGVYITGDWELLRSEDKFSSVLGGYQAYERRMLARLLDTTDPNRPDFTTSTAVLAAFFYVSSGDVNDLLRSVNAIVKFFGRPDLMSSASPYGTPTAPEMKYGAEGAGAGAFRQLSQAVEDDIPDSVSVSWTMPAGAGGITTAFQPAPKGFLIHVSTIQDGLQVLALTAKAESSAEVENLPRVAAGAVDPVTNGPLKLFGGVADIGVTSNSKDFGSVEASDDPQAPLIVLQKDQNTPLIKPSTLKPTSGDVPLLACTYFVRTTFASRMGAGTTFTATFPKSLLPKHASFSPGTDGYAEASEEDARKFWFRIRALTDDYASALANVIDGTLDSPANVYASDYRIYRFSREKALEAVNGVLLPENPGLDGSPAIQPSSFTAASGAGVAEFPTAAQAEYIQAVQAAVAVAILTRADLTESSFLQGVGIISSAGEFRYNQFAVGQATGLEPAGRDLLARYGIKPVWFRGNRPQQFRLRMRYALARVASDLQERAAPPESVASAVVNEAQALLTFRWSDLDEDYPNLTILESLGIGADPEESEGVGANPFCRGKPKYQVEAEYEETNGGPPRAPSFNERQESDIWVIGEGSADYSPIIYSDSAAKVEFIRNALVTNGTQVISGAASTLQLAAAAVSRPAGDTSWVAIRLLPQGLVPVDELLERLDRFLQGVLDGLEGITDKIVAYIEAIQARIYQLQALLNQIRALLRALDFFRLPSVSGLVVVASGTDGVVTELVSATNKPFDSANSYGAGVAVVSGGVPAVLLELLALLLNSGDS